MAEEIYPSSLRYHHEHGWVHVEHDEAVFGITWFAQGALGEIIYADMPMVGDEVFAGTPCGELESLKTVTSVIAPASGEVLQVNEALRGEPRLVNEDCYGRGWLVRVRISDPAQINHLMDANAYRVFLQQA